MQEYECSSQGTHNSAAGARSQIKYDSYGTISVAISDFGLSRKGSTYMSGTGFGPIKWMVRDTSGSSWTSGHHHQSLAHSFTHTAVL